MQTYVPSCRPNGVVEGEIQRALNLAKTRKTANTFYVPLMALALPPISPSRPQKNVTCAQDGFESIPKGPTRIAQGTEEIVK